MRLMRRLATLTIVMRSASTIYAQDSTPTTLSNTTLIAIIVIIVTMAGVMILLWRRIVQRQRELLGLGQSDLTARLDATEQIDSHSELKIPLDTTENRLPVPRTDGDYRPYLVLDLRQSSNSFLAEGERFVITPNDTPYIIGSQSDADLRIVDSHVSADHLHIAYDPQTKQYALTDADSANGSRWDGDTMVKKRAYRIKQGRDVTLEIAVSYGFVMYIDAVSPDQTQLMVSPFADRPDSDVEIPAQEPLPEGIVATLNWQSLDTRLQRTFTPEQTVTIIGRDDNVDVQITHNLISKMHAYLIWDVDQFYLLDMSSNGTWVTTGAQGRVRIPYGELIPLDIDTSLIIEVAKETVLLDFHYAIEQKLDEKSRAITDKLPELPKGVRPLLHIVREGPSEQRKEIRISTSIITIGSDVSSIIPLKRDPVAEYHAKIIWEDGKFWVHDLSGMGTTVDRKLLRRSKISLLPHKIYPIRINENRPEETLIEFYYHLKDELADLEAKQASSPIPDDSTQRIDSTF